MKIALDLIKIVWQNINALIPIKKGYCVSPQDSKKCQGHLFLRKEVFQLLEQASQIIFYPVQYKIGQINN